MTGKRNGVFWRRGARPRPVQPRAGRGWAAACLFCCAAVATALGVAGTPFPVDERVEADVVILAEPPTRESAEVCQQLAAVLSERPDVAAVEVRIRSEIRDAFGDIWKEGKKL